MVMCMFSMCKVRNNSVDNETHYRREPPTPHLRGEIWGLLL